MSTLSISGMGLCQCGCGGKTWIPKYSDAKYGYIAGQPVRYITGHHKALPRGTSRLIVVEGILCRTIPLPHGKEAIVDIKDYPRLSRYRWHTTDSKDGKLYAVRDTKTGTIKMHQMIRKVPKGKEIDHKNINGLDNRRCNLRTCTRSQNNANRRKRKGCSSQYKGVRLHRLTGKYTAQIRYGNRTHHLGYFVPEVDAAIAYDEVARKVFGKYARFNFPREGERGIND